MEHEEHDCAAIREDESIETNDASGDLNLGTHFLKNRAHLISSTFPSCPSATSS